MCLHITYTHSHTHAHAHTRMNVNIYVHTHTHTHKHTHTHTHTNTLMMRNMMTHKMRVLIPSRIQSQVSGGGGALCSLQPAYIYTHTQKIYIHTYIHIESKKRENHYVLIQYIYSCNEI